MTTTSLRPTGAPDIEQLPEPPLRRSMEIQGNILSGFNKDYMAFRYVRFPDGAGGRGWLSVMLNTVSVTATVEDFNEEFSLSRRAYGQDPFLVATWVGVSLTFQGLLQVAREPEKVKQDLAPFESFVKGAAGRAPDLGDDGTSAPEHWHFGSDRNGVHAVLIVAADTEEALNEKLRNIAAADSAHGVTLVHQDDGRTLTGDLRGHEHFGYKDAISQPGVKDFHREDRENPGVRDNRPGSTLVEPGEFVFGHQSESGAPPEAPMWMDNGSLQVVRRLRQDVPGWNEAVEREAGKFRPHAISPELLGACLVGRKKDGTPLAQGENPVTGVGPERNDFTYENDGQGKQTPCAAHIRRSHPRHFEPTQKHRVMRRGIPYGPAYSAGKADADRGLMFVCYGTSLERQFEFLQRAWSNNPNFLPGDPGSPNGIDKVTGTIRQGGSGSPDAHIVLADGEEGTVSMNRFVQTTGAVYAFTPSISTLRRLAANESLDGKG
ncbi:Dyp-type peroxidase [Streptomyces lydicamycinicus]|uniref:Dyp-type peroxidase n=1 Tax=Streptomyces lydicamycinicus TaxID=1546107 RepID=UPI0020357C41|nr:Dyp-type peroxidase [Streptomyces lydicamycinicus]USA00058.1 Dyp-type peroxidase [Streptomyces lydicamycinicus]